MGTARKLTEIDNTSKDIALVYLHICLNSPLKLGKRFG